MQDQLDNVFDESGQIIPEVLEDLMIEISTGRTVFEHGRDLFATRQPTITEQDRARIIYRRALQVAANEGCPTRRELENWGLEAGIIDPDERQEKNNLLGMIKRFAGLREKCTDAEQKIKIDSDIGQARMRLEEIEVAEYDLLQHSREEKAERTRQFYYVSCCTMGGEVLDTPVWKDYVEFQSSTDMGFIVSARRALIRVSRGLPIKVIRAMARNPDWRSRWKACKDSGVSPFDGTGSGWDRNKIGLIYWSNFYDSVYAHPDCPAEDTINNDEFLQNWINQQVVKRQQNTQNPMGKSNRPVTYMQGGRRKAMTKIGETRSIVNTPVKVRTGHE